VPIEPYYRGQGVTLYLGDSLELLEDMDPLRAGAVITDPPYSSGGMFRGDRTNGTTDEKYTRSTFQGKRPDFSGDNMDQRSWASWCHRWLSECRRHTRPSGYLCCFTDWRQLPTLTDVIQHAGWVWRGVNVWDKTEAAKGPHTGYFAYQCEFVPWATNGPCVRRPTLAEGGDGKLFGCHRRAVSQADKHHQTGKMPSVMRWLVKCCPRGDLVLDPFAGSGTTLVAAVLSGRSAVGVELAEDYCAVAARRLEAAVRNGEVREVRPVKVRGVKRGVHSRSR
jgi:site-specific DNA-methyltransferase (adenine-specific)